MRRRFPIIATIVVGVLLLGTGLALWGCGGQPAVDSETSVPTSTAAVGTTAVPPDEATGDYVSVLHPYHNEFLDAPTYLIPESITLAHSLPEFPESVPAQRISSEMLPDTDLALEPHPSVAGRYSWLSSVDDMAQTDVALGSQDVAAEVARAFLEAHDLWDEDYSAPQVSVGSSESGADVKITSWAVRFDREPVAAGLERYVRVRVGDNDEVIQVSLAIPQVEPLGDKLVRLRPVAEVAADPQAWQMGDSGALQNEIQGTVAVEIRSVFLAYEDPGSGDEPIAVPVYRFEVEVRGLDGAAPTTGFWTVVAAADVVRNPQESGMVMALETAANMAHTTSSIVPQPDGTFMSLAPEEIVSAVIEVPAYPAEGETRRRPVDLENVDTRDELLRLVNGLTVSPELAVEPLARVLLHVTLQSGREFYVIWFEGYPLLFKDFIDGKMVTYEAVESAEMSAFLAQYR